ncbi:uncharacterized protein LOC109802636 [Cajanus cajan]|uniref:uncharacterized protein LOC109802636 n=1 Tax=Cajanus cajan TaxID=3821 RepID=UPI0010FAE8DD|nr:uncharacterized protein LOC109802636 [Cajanus cajan]
MVAPYIYTLHPSPPLTVLIPTADNNSHENRNIANTTNATIVVPNDDANTTNPIVPVSSSITNTGSTVLQSRTKAHSMTTRAKAGIFRPKIYTAKAAAHIYDSTIEPHTVKEALSKPEWCQAMKEEYEALIKNNTWTLVDLPPGCNAIGCKWVFKSKFNADGSFHKHKARLIAKGYHQRAGFDFTDTFSPMVKPTTVRVVLTLALSKQWHMHQIDINNAFLHGTLKEIVYMNQPPGFDSREKGKVCRLQKAIYGLKQAPRSWFQTLSHFLITMGFTAAKSDTSLFIKITQTFTLLVLVYVDDIIVTGSSKSEVVSLVTKLNYMFKLKDLGPLHYFLGIEVSNTTDGGLILSQAKYIRDLLHRAKMTDSKSQPTPMVSGLKLQANGSAAVTDPTFYRSIVGGLQYITITRPELSFSINRVCQFMHNP